MNKTMTNNELIITRNRLNDFIEKDKVTPGKISYAITKNYKALEEALDPLKTEQQKILKKIEEANNSDMSDEEKTEFTNKMNKSFEEILTTNVDVSIHMISENEIIDISGMSAKDYLALDFMIEKAEDEDSNPVPTSVEQYLKAVDSK